MSISLRHPGGTRKWTTTTYPATYMHYGFPISGWGCDSSIGGCPTICLKTETTPPGECASVPMHLEAQGFNVDGSITPTWNFSMKAPETPGSYAIFWQMVNLSGYSATWFGEECGQTIEVVDAPPSCTSAEPQEYTTTATSGIFYVYAYGVNNATQVKFAVWTNVDDQDDLAWYDGVDQGGGTWRTEVNLANHDLAGRKSVC